MQSVGLGKARPDVVLTAGGLSAGFGECKRDRISVEDTWNDLGSYFSHGLPKLFYQNIPYIPTFIATGSKLQFGVLHQTGMVRCVKRGSNKG